MTAFLFYIWSRDLYLEHRMAFWILLVLEALNGILNLGPAGTDVDNIIFFFSIFFSLVPSLPLFSSCSFVQDTAEFFAAQCPSQGIFFRKYAILHGGCNNAVEMSGFVFKEPKTKQKPLINVIARIKRTSPFVFSLRRKVCTVRFVFLAPWNLEWCPRTKNGILNMLLQCLLSIFKGKFARCNVICALHLKNEFRGSN